MIELAIGATLAAAALLWWLLARAKKKREEEQQTLDSLSGAGSGGSSSGNPSQSGSAGSEQSDEERRQEQGRLNERLEARRQAEAEAERARIAEAERKAKELRDRETVLNKLNVTTDPLLLQMAQSMAGDAHRELVKTPGQEEVRRLAQRLGNQQIATLRLAAEQRDVVMDLSARITLEPVLYPTNIMKPDQMVDLTEVGQTGPESMILDDDQWVAAAATNNLMIMRSYEQHTFTKLLYVVMDVSSSMQKAMRSGISRHFWSRAVGANLLRQAIEGSARYLFRFFDGMPHPLLQAKSPAEAKVLLDKVLATGMTNGGTNIRNALKQAVADIKANPANQCNILVITDGEDESIADIPDIKMLLGDIQLYAVVLGTHSDALKELATSYQHFE